MWDVHLSLAGVYKSPKSLTNPWKGLKISWPSSEQLVETGFCNLRNSNESVPKEECWVRYNVLIVKWAHIHVQRVGNMHSSYYMYWWMLISCLKVSFDDFRSGAVKIQHLKLTIYHKRKFSNYFSLILKVLGILTMLFCLFKPKIGIILESSISFPVVIVAFYCVLYFSNFKINFNF